MAAYHKELITAAIRSFRLTLALIVTVSVHATQARASGEVAALVTAFKSYCFDTDGRPGASALGNNFVEVRPECEDGPCQVAVKTWQVGVEGMPVLVAEIRDGRCVVAGTVAEPDAFDRTRSLVDLFLKGNAWEGENWFTGPSPGSHATKVSSLTDARKVRGVSISEGVASGAMRPLSLTWISRVP